MVVQGLSGTPKADTTGGVAMNKQYVMMPVMCMGKLCNNCPNLHIDTTVHQLFADGGSVGYQIDLKCRSVERCDRIRQMMEEENDERS